MKSKVYQMTDDEFILLVNESNSITEILTKIGLCKNSGATAKIVKRRLEELNLKINYITKKGKKYELKEILVENSNYQNRNILKSRLISNNLLKNECFECGLKDIWNKKSIKLELDHINGIHNDNRLENLRLLCPNCHSQTETYCGKNIKYEYFNELYDIENIEEIINNSFSKKEILLKLNLQINKKNLKKLTDILIDKNITLENKKFSQKKLINTCICGQNILKHNKLCKKCTDLKKRKVERPPLEQLLKEIEETNYSAVGRKYGVSDMTIRKWIKSK